MKKNKLHSIRSYRLITQGFVFVFITYLVLKEIFAGTNTIVPSPEAYCPFGGIESLYLFFTEGRTLSHLHSSNIIILGIIVLITLFFRSGFCGWLCPFGTIQDGIRKIGIWIGGLFFLKSINRIYKRLISKKIFFYFDKGLRYAKYLIMIWAILGAVYYVDLVFRDYDPFVALIKVVELESFIGVIILGIILLLSLFTERPWCKYFCPLGALIGIIGKISPMRIKKTSSLCKSCHLCSKSCPMGIDVIKKSSVNSIDCNQCLTCIDHCPVDGALELGLYFGGNKNEKK